MYLVYIPQTLFPIFHTTFNIPFLRHGNILVCGTIRARILSNLKSRTFKFKDCCCVFGFLFLSKSSFSSYLSDFSFFPKNVHYLLTLFIPAPITHISQDCEPYRTLALPSHHAYSVCFSLFSFNNA